jgi:glutamate:Na+ symporter, ESS family
MTFLPILATFSPLDYDVTWNFVVQIAIVCAILLLSNGLRRKAKFIQKSLLPTAIIGGFVGLGIKYLFSHGLQWQIDGQAIISSGLMSTITFHMIAIGYIALILKGTDKIDALPKGDRVHPFKSGLFIVSTYLLQGIIGMIITIPLFYIFSEVAPYSGMLLPMGYGQGPGQANNIGSIYESTAGFVGGQSFALTISTMGFVVACIGGVIYLNILVRRGKLKKIERIDTNKTTYQSMVEGSDEIPLVESIDKLTIQVAFVGLVYLMTWGVMFGLMNLFNLTGVNFLINTVTPLIFGFNFIVGTFMALLVKKIIKTLRKSKLMRRQYINDYMMNRIAGVAFDFMIITSIMAIDIERIASIGLIVALMIIGLAGAFGTFLYHRHITRRVYPAYSDAALLAFFGTLTGTASTGITILREYDPNFETPAANDVVFGSTTAIMLGFPVLLLVGIVFTTFGEGAPPYDLTGTPTFFDGWLYPTLAIMITIFTIYYIFLVKKPRISKAKKESSSK